MAKAPTAAQRRIYQAAMQLFAERGVSQVSVSDLAEYADVARGTIYNNIGSMETLFEEVAANLSSEMNQRVVDSLDKVDDPVQRMAYGIRLYVKRAHEEPVWGQFISTFALSNAAVQALWKGHPAQDLLEGMNKQRYRLTMDELPSALGQIGCSVISAMFLVREGIKTWREAGSIAAEFTLRAFGVGYDEAHDLATRDMGDI